MGRARGDYLHTALAALMNGDRRAGDMRSHAERQVDTLVALPSGALDGGGLPTGRGERPHLRVTIDLMALCAERGAAGFAGGSLGWAGPINAETARRLACDAGVARILTGPSGLPLDVGREQRTRSTAIRRAIEIRDEHRVFAGCDAPPEWCDVHHVVHWAHGGPTSCENGGAALRAAPHQLPRGRVHHPSGSRHRPMAHLPAGRHRDPPPRRPLTPRRPGPLAVATRVGST
ncbi:DUF222 domain-containing protein [Blastococcus sp. SYSU DS0539]